MTKSQKSKLARDYSTTVTILEHLSDALFILNPDGRIEYANRVALDMLGIKLQDILGQSFNQFLIADFKPDMLYDKDNPELLLENIYKGVFSEIETSLIHNEYSTSVVISFGLVRDAEQNISFIIASAKDITVRKELEKELQQQQLMALSRDRYKELGELAVNMVHNLSQPITSIRLMMELIEKQVRSGKVDKDQFQRYFRETTQLLDEMTTSIAHVRNFAFLSEDETVKSVKVQDVLDSALKQIAYELKERDIDLQQHLAGNLSPVLANPMSLQQVFITLFRYFWSEQPLKTKIPTLGIEIVNVQDRWLRIRIHNFANQDVESPTATPSESGEQPLIGSHLDLTVVQIIMTSFGGDFRMQSYAGDRVEFILRIPVDTNTERDQLRNLIELLHG